MPSVNPTPDPLEALLPRQRQPRVLVIDDDWLNRDLLSMYLKDAGYTLEAAEDGEKGLNMAIAAPPDLVLCDVQMPKLNGYEVCRRLKANPDTRFVPVVMVTALDSDEEKLRAVESGADDFITKPFNSIMLLTRVRSLLRIKQLHDDVEARNNLLRQILNRYMAEDVVDVILTDPERHLQLGGETRHIAVLFADIRGFTSHTERISAEQVVTTLNYIFPRLTELVFKYGGTFDKYVGDCIMAFWGAPITTGDDAGRAVQAALEMRDMFAQLQQENPELMGTLGLGIGLHMGDATVGNIGSERVMDYTAVGDTVNVAARLQENALPNQILISEALNRELHGRINTEWLGPQPVHGRSDPVIIYQLRGLIS